jgi:hypothetical protein
MLVLGLQHQHIGSASHTTFKIEIRPSSKADPGYIELHHMDLDPLSSRDAVKNGKASAMVYAHH